MLDCGYGGLFENRDAQAGCCSRFSNAQVQRVQVAVPVTYEGAIKCVGSELCSIPDLVGFRCIVLPACRDVLVEPLDLSRLDRNLGIAVFEVAFDTVLRDALADDVIAAPLHVPHEVGNAVSMPVVELVETAAAMNELTAIPAGRAPTDPVGLQ